MKFKYITPDTRYSEFSGDSGCGEYYLVIEPQHRSPLIANSLKSVFREINNALSELKLSTDDLVFSRIFLSDIANQKTTVEDSELFGFLRNGAVSVIEQPPASGANMTLLLYFIKNGGLKKEPLSGGNDKWLNGIQLQSENYTQYWHCNCSASGELDSHRQTKEIFDKYENFLASKNITLSDNVIRTWIYVRDIDNHYLGMVQSRKKLFEENGLNELTHYIASTGIEARLKDVSTLVSMDVLAVDGLKDEQITYLEALEHLNPTHEYGVTFERGTKISYGDREHYFISGTASIDKNGDVVHVGDILKQTERTIENISALLSPHGAQISDMAYLIVYLRDFGNAETVKNKLSELLDCEIPLIIVQGAVCRPQWLIEIEGVGIRRNTTPFPEFFSNK